MPRPDFGIRRRGSKKNNGETSQDILDMGVVPESGDIPVCMYACMHAWMDGCMHAWMDGCMHACMHACMDAWMHGCMDAWMHGWMDGWMDGWDGWMYGCRCR